MTSLRSKYHGSLLGLAAGDALGTTIEFKAPGTSTPLTDMVGGGPFNLKKGQWTDDTSMALCLAESLVRCRGFDAHDQWSDTDDGGKRATSAVMEDVLTLATRCLVHYRSMLERGTPLPGPRTLPQQAMGADTPCPHPAILCWRSGKGHPHRAQRATNDAWGTCLLDACRYFSALIIGSLHGATKRELLSRRYTPVHGLWDSCLRKIDEIACGSFKQKEPPQIVGSGYVSGIARSSTLGLQPGPRLSRKAVSLP